MRKMEFRNSSAARIRSILRLAANTIDIEFTRFIAQILKECSDRGVHIPGEEHYEEDKNWLLIFYYGGQHQKAKRKSYIPPPSIASSVQDYRHENNFIIWRSEFLPLMRAWILNPKSEINLLKGDALKIANEYLIKYESHLTGEEINFIRLSLKFSLEEEDRKKCYRYRNCAEAAMEAASQGANRVAILLAAIVLDGGKMIDPSIEFDFNKAALSVIYALIGTHIEKRGICIGASATAFCISNDGMFLGVGRVDGTLSVWNVRSRKEIGILKTQLFDIVGLKFSGDGIALVAFSSHKEVEIWEIKSEFLMLRIKNERIESAEISDDHRFFVSINQNQLIDIYELSDGHSYKYSKRISGHWSQVEVDSDCDTLFLSRQGLLTTTQCSSKESIFSIIIKNESIKNLHLSDNQRFILARMEDETYQIGKMSRSFGVAEFHVLTQFHHTSGESYAWKKRNVNSFVTNPIEYNVRFNESESMLLLSDEFATVAFDCQSGKLIWSYKRNSTIEKNIEDIYCSISAEGNFWIVDDYFHDFLVMDFHSGFVSGFINDAFRSKSISYKKVAPMFIGNSNNICEINRDGDFSSSEIFKALPDVEIISGRMCIRQASFSDDSSLVALIYYSGIGKVWSRALNKFVCNFGSRSDPAIAAEIVSSNSKIIAASESGVIQVFSIDSNLEIDRINVGHHVHFLVPTKSRNKSVIILSGDSFASKKSVYEYFYEADQEGNGNQDCSNKLVNLGILEGLANDSMFDIAKYPTLLEVLGTNNIGSGDNPSFRLNNDDYVSCGIGLLGSSGSLLAFAANIDPENEKSPKNDSNAFYLVVINIEDGKEISRFPYESGESKIMALSTGCCDRYLCAIGKSDARIYDVNTKEFICSIKILWEQNIRATFSNDGAYVLILADDCKVDVYETGTGSLIFTNQPSLARVRFSIFSTDSRSVLIAEEDGRTIIFPVKPFAIEEILSYVQSLDARELTEEDFSRYRLEPIYQGECGSFDF